MQEEFPSRKAETRALLRKKQDTAKGSESETKYALCYECAKCLPPGKHPPLLLLQNLSFIKIYGVQVQVALTRDMQGTKDKREK